MTVREAATRLGVSELRVRKLARDELVTGAVEQNLRFDQRALDFKDARTVENHES